MNYTFLLCSIYYLGYKQNKRFIFIHTYATSWEFYFSTKAYKLEILLLVAIFIWSSTNNMLQHSIKPWNIKYMPRKGMYITNKKTIIIIIIITWKRDNAYFTSVSDIWWWNTTLNLSIVNNIDNDKIHMNYKLL